MVLSLLGVLYLWEKAFRLLPNVEFRWYILMSIVLSLLELMTDLLRVKVKGSWPTLTLKVNRFHWIETFRGDPWLLKVCNVLTLHWVRLLLNHMLSWVILGASCLL